MSNETQSLPRGSRFLLTAACVVVVIAGLKAAGSLVLPVLVAGLLAIVCIPPMRRLQGWGVPAVLAIVVIGAVAILVVVLITVVVGNSISNFTASLPEYRERLDAMLGGVLGWLDGHGIAVSGDKRLTDMLDSAALMGLVADTTGALLDALSNLFVILLIMIFMLFEPSGFSGKLRRALGKPDADLAAYAHAADQVYSYLYIKGGLSLLTGVLVMGVVALAGVDFPVLWGLVAFLFNFVPNIGSIIAAVPAVLLALIQLGPGPAAFVGGGYVVVNVVIGNVIEPRVMGSRLGLSTLVVFLSLIFWNWVWGPLGMLLSVPLTVIVKIMLEHTEDFRPVAILLGPAGAPEPPSEPEEE